MDLGESGMNGVAENAGSLQHRPRGSIVMETHKPSTSGQCIADQGLGLRGAEGLYLSCACSFSKC